MRVQILGEAVCVHFMLMPLGKAWIHLFFSHHQGVNSSLDKATNLGEEKIWNTSFGGKSSILWGVWSHPFIAITPRSSDSEW